MKEDKIEYYPNGSIKHRISYYDNGITSFKTYRVHNKFDNINNPANINFDFNGKIRFKKYRINEYKYSKLIWMNIIKKLY